MEIPAVNRYTNKVRCRPNYRLPAYLTLGWQLALIIIATCGFGRPMSWKAPDPSPGEMSFEAALAIVSNRIIARVILPQWAYSLPIKW